MKSPIPIVLCSPKRLGFGIFAFGIFLLSSSLHAQRTGHVDFIVPGTWSLSGLVCDSATKAVVPNARVSVYASCTWYGLPMYSDSLLWTGAADSLGKFSAKFSTPCYTCTFRFLPEAEGHALPKDRWKYALTGGIIDDRNFNPDLPVEIDLSATVWMKRTRGVRLVEKLGDD